MEDEGKKAWTSLTNQLFELKGFTMAFISSLFRFFLKNIVFILVLPALFGGATYLWYGQAEPTYQASMTVSYVHLEKKIYGDMVVKLNQSIKSGGILGMPGFESMPQDFSSALLKVEAINLKGEELTSDLSSDHIPFDLVVTVSDLEALKDIEKALVVYLDSPHFVQERLTYNMKNAKDQMSYYCAQVASMQSKLDEIDAANNSEVLEALVNQMNDAKAKMTEAERQLTFNSNIEVLHGLQASSAQQNEPGNKRSKMATLLGLLIALSVGVFRLSNESA